MSNLASDAYAVSQQYQILKQQELQVPPYNNFNF